MTKYLYGASVQGIQGFIFETNKLKEIAGASELVEQICTKEFEKQLAEKFNENNALLQAAGNIKYIFDSYDACQSAVLDFPKKVLNKAPGISISQAVVAFEGDKPKKADFNELEKKLNAEKNKKEVSVTTALMLTERARKTGNAGVKYEKERNSDDVEVIDLAQLKKRNIADEVAEISKKLTGKVISPKDFTFEIEEIAKDKQGSENWIAVVHADGNNLGKIIQNIFSTVNEEKQSQVYKQFSKKLDEATIRAAQIAYKEIIEPNIDNKYPPIRPIVIGGDDLTVIVRGDLALDFTQVFLKEFEEKSKEYFKPLVEDFNVDILRDGLTACAGIAFIKPKYPFHYAVDLAETLCGDAKKSSKEIEGIPSSISFHKVQSSFTDDFKSIKERELMAGKNDLYQGPYFINEKYKKPTVTNLIEQIYTINEKDAPKGPIRNWLNELHKSEESAKQLMQRIISLNNSYVKELNLDKNKNNLHLHDIVNLSSIIKEKK